MVRFIDIEAEEKAKKGQNERDKKESVRELERKREQKDLDKMIKAATKM